MTTTTYPSGAGEAIGDVLVVIPAYNEEANVAKVIARPSECSRVTRKLPSLTM